MDNVCSCCNNNDKLFYYIGELFCEECISNYPPSVKQFMVEVEFEALDDVII